jgi:hypothetical protein
MVYEDFELKVGGIFLKRLISRTFRIFVSISLFFLFVINDDWLEFLYINSFVLILILAFVIAAIGWFGIKLDKWLDTLPFQIPIRLFTSILLILFFTYLLFTPYFYSDKYLEKVGIESIETYYQLSNDNLSNQEREKLAKSLLSEEMAFSTLKLESYPKGKLVGIDPLEINRSYYLYYFTVEVKQRVRTNIEKVTYRFTIDKVDGGFKINGFEVLN